MSTWLPAGSLFGLALRLLGLLGGWLSFRTTGSSIIWTEGITFVNERT